MTQGEPYADRPDMPGYGILAADAGAGLLPWARAMERLARSRHYWLATVWPDGRPHVMPVWGVWDADRLWFSSSRASRKARNLLRDPRCTVTTDDPVDPVVVEGWSELVDDPDAVTTFADAVNAKYETDYPAEFYHPPANAVFRVRPTWAFALAGDDFAGTPTRWRFGTRRASGGR